MKKVGFSQFSSTLLMLPLKFIVMNTLHSVLDQTVYLLCRKVCQYKSYTGMKNRSERKFPCRGQSKMHFLFAIWSRKLANNQENQLALVIEIIKKLFILKFWITLLMSTWKCQCFNQIAREPSNMVKVREEQSKKLNYTVPFKIDHITLHGIFLSLQSFILR